MRCAAEAIEEMAPVRFLATFAAPRQLVEADRNRRPEQRKARAQRKGERHEAIVERQGCDDQTDQRVEEADD